MAISIVTGTIVNPPKPYIETDTIDLVILYRDWKYPFSTSLKVDTFNTVYIKVIFMCFLNSTIENGYSYEFPKDKNFKINQNNVTRIKYNDVTRIQVKQVKDVWN